MDDAEAAERIAAWTTGGEGEFAQFAVFGAREGGAFAREAARVLAPFDKLNAPAWLYARFTAGHAELAIGE